MRAVGIEQLRDRLSEYVRLAAAGETVLVTDRDKPVARLTPATDEDRLVAADPRAELIRDGIVIPAKRPPGIHWRRRGLVSHAQLMADLDGDREDRI
jgi:prevent-host-death family protein